MTANATIIYSIINESQDHLTAEEIFIALKMQDHKISLATVYNNLNTLSELGYIRKVSIEGHADRYDRVIRHDHLVCKQCGALSDIFLEDLTEKLREQIGENILSYDLKVHYLCPDCKQKNEV